MSDWQDACDPTQPVRERREISSAEAARRRRRAQRMKGFGKLRSFADTDDLAGDFLEPAFYEMEA